MSLPAYFSWKDYPYLRGICFGVGTYEDPPFGGNLTVNTSTSQSSVISKSYGYTTLNGTGTIDGSGIILDQTQYIDEIDQISTKMSGQSAEYYENFNASSDSSPTLYGTNSSSAYIYQASADVRFSDFTKITFDAEKDPDATFGIYIPPSYKLILDNFTVTDLIEYSPEAKPENVFIVCYDLEIDDSLGYASSFGNVVVVNDSGAVISIQLNQLISKGSFYFVGYDVQIGDADNYIIVGSYPNTSIDNYFYLKAYHLYVTGNINVDSGPLTIEDSYFKYVTPSGDYVYTNGGSIVGGIKETDANKKLLAKRDYMSLIDYLQKECYDIFAPDNLTDLTSGSEILPVNSGHCYSLTTSSLGGMYTVNAEGYGASAMFLIYVDGPITLNSDITFFLTNSANINSLFICCTTFQSLTPPQPITGFEMQHGVFIPFDDTIVDISLNNCSFYNSRFYVANEIYFTGENFMSNADICFRSDTMIATPFGKKKVECLQKGDLVYATGSIKDNKVHMYECLLAVPLRFVGLKTSDVSEKTAPVRIPKDCFGEGAPDEDLYVSRNHGIIVDGILVPAYKLMESHGLEQCYKERTVTYYHIELDAHSGVLANNLPAESFLDGGNRKCLQEIPRSRTAKRST
jgi:hypothetical protein